MQKRTLKEVLDEEMPPEVEPVNEFEESSVEKDSATQLRREATTSQLKDSKTKAPPLRATQSAAVLTHSTGDKQANGKGEPGKKKRSNKGHKAKSPAGTKSQSPKPDDRGSSRKKAPLQKISSEPNQTKLVAHPKSKDNTEESSSATGHSESKLKRSKKGTKDEEEPEIGSGKSKRNKKGNKDKDSEEDGNST